MMMNATTTITFVTSTQLVKIHILRITATVIPALLEMGQLAKVGLFLSERVFSQILELQISTNAITSVTIKVKNALTSLGRMNVFAKMDMKAMAVTALT